MTNEMYEDLLERNRLQISELNTLTEEQDKHIEKLEKENAELKNLEDVAILIKANNDTVITLMQLNNNLVSKSQQLTKAKEIIQKLYNIVCGRSGDDWGVIKQAEKFIREVEE